MSALLSQKLGVGTAKNKHADNVATPQVNASGNGAG
jgi:hypothetical protein